MKYVVEIYNSTSLLGKKSSKKIITVDATEETLPTVIFKLYNTKKWRIIE